MQRAWGPKRWAQRLARIETSAGFPSLRSVRRLGERDVTSPRTSCPETVTPPKPRFLRNCKGPEKRSAGPALICGIQTNGPVLHKAPMFRKTMILFPAALLGSMPLVASAEAMDRGELEMFRDASLTIRQAGDAGPGAPSSPARRRNDQRTDAARPDGPAATCSPRRPRARAAKDGRPRLGRRHTALRSREFSGLRDPARLPATDPPAGESIHSEARGDAARKLSEEKAPRGFERPHLEEARQLRQGAEERPRRAGRSRRNRTMTRDPVMRNERNPETVKARERMRRASQDLL